MPIKMTDEQAERYRSYLNTYRRKFNKEPGPCERTEAFFYARSADPWDRPNWIVNN